MSSSLTEFDDSHLIELVRSLGGKDFQGRQIFHWLYRHGARDWGDCRNLPKSLLEKLAEQHSLRSCSLGTVDVSRDGTRKMLVQLADGEAVEAVLIPEGRRQTLCLSTQVGCPVGCVFCASGLDGLRRNLTRGEIIEQVLLARELLPLNASLTNLVVMGMGEPMLNLDELLPALERIHDPEGINLGARRITVSSSGYPKMIDRFAETPHGYNLAISLHAADEELRRELVPHARCTVAELLASARRYFERKGREITFEVVLLGGRNDRSADARAMIQALDGFPCTVNLIPWNPVDRIEGLSRPTEADAESFAERLRAGGLKVTLRRQRGADRSAACGQLRLANC
ncbi:MAG: dual-specificity RNA methyltransferase RlmN [Planctomycetota bacterium]|jgi:23S rRNA (adenine2503-C2)-methyltransferase